MRSLSVLLVAVLVAAGCGGLNPAAPTTQNSAAALTANASGQSLKGGRPDISGDWLLPVTFTEVSEGCGGSPVVGTTFTEQIVVTQKGSDLDWQVTAETERYEGKLKGNGSLEVSGLAAADTDGQQFIGTVDSSGQSMNGTFTFTSASCSIAGTFAASRP